MAIKEEPTVVTEQVGRDFDPDNAADVYKKGKPLGPSAAGVSFGKIPYKSATGMREVPGIIYPPSPVKQAKKQVGIAAPPALSFTDEEMAKADALYNKANPVATPEEIGIAQKDVADRVSAINKGLPSPEMPSAFQSNTVLPEEKVQTTAEGTIPTKGMSTRIGEQDFSKYATPTEFGIIQNAKTPKEKALTPDAQGNFDWNKIRGMDNITLSAQAMKLTPEKQKEVDRAKLKSEYDTLSKKYGVDAGYMRGLEKRLGIGDEGMTAAQRESLDQNERHHQDKLMREGKQDEAAASAKQYDEFKTQYAMPAGTEAEGALDWVKIANDYPKVSSIKNPTVRNYVSKRLTDNFYPYRDSVLKANAGAISSGQTTEKKVLSDAWTNFMKTEMAKRPKL